MTFLKNNKNRLALVALVAVVSVVAFMRWPEKRLDAGELRLLSKAHAVSILVMSNDLLGEPQSAPDDKPEPQGDECENCYGTGRSGDGISVCGVCNGTGKRKTDGSLPEEPPKAAKKVVKRIYLHTMPGCPPCKRWKDVELPKAKAAGWDVEIVQYGSKYGSYPSFRVYQDVTKEGGWVKGFHTFEQLKEVGK